MALPCGCEFVGGMALPAETAKEHFKHTMMAMLFWEMAYRPGEDSLASLPLSEARIAYTEALEARFPELKED